MSKKILTIQDISCYGQCSVTVALPILSALGFETAILPSAILSTHTAGFKDFTVLDLTNEMPKIINHWKSENIKFDVIYTGYIGNKIQFDYILDIKNNLLNEGGLFIVDPAMADNGNMYYGLGNDIVEGMIKISKEADYILPNITEASFLTGNKYQEIQTKEYQDKLIKDLYKLGAKNVILTGVTENNKIGARAYNGIDDVTVLKEKEKTSYHGTGDIFSSIVIGNILNGLDFKANLDKATDFIIDSIRNTVNDKSHSYGVKYEEILKEYRLK
jgi:pyridoxine kinase